MSKRKSTSPDGRLSSSAYREAALRRAAERLLGVHIASVEHPGGRSRESYRLVPADGEAFIGTRRREIERARLETRILRGLNRHDVKVPALLGSNHAHILFQQEIVGNRLSEALRTSTPDGISPLLTQALTSLAEIHDAAEIEELGQHVESLGTSDSWLRGLIARPSVIGRHLGIDAPTLDQDALLETLRVEAPAFIKWDARPGNALVRADGSVFWFDWEHAGRRHRLDDVAWLLGDEFIPDAASTEQALIDRFVPVFAGTVPLDRARDYLMTYGSFHIVIRLGLILKYMDGEWWDLERCIAEDKVGVTLECARRLCRRGARWADASRHAAPLADWFRAIEPAIADL